MPPKKPPSKERGFNARAFYQSLVRVVDSRQMTWRKVAQETGISHSTLSRMAADRRPDAASLALLSAWAGLNPAHFVTTPQTDPLHPLAAILSFVETDPTLSPNAQQALKGIIALAYEVLAKMPQDQSTVLGDGEDSDMPLKEADYAKWSKVDFWSVDQAAFLLSGYEPLVGSGKLPDSISYEYSVLRRLLSANAGKLSHYEDDPRMGPRFWYWDVIHWAQARSLRLPEQLKEQILEGAAFPSRTRSLLERVQRLQKETVKAKLALKSKRTRSRRGSG